MDAVKRLVSGALAVAACLRDPSYVLCSSTRLAEKMSLSNMRVLPCLAVVACLVVTVAASAPPPGLIVRVFQKGLSYGRLLCVCTSNVVIWFTLDTFLNDSCVEHP